MDPEAFGWTAASILQDKDFAAIPRDLDVAELFSGVGSTSHAALHLGHTSVSRDKFRELGKTNTRLRTSEDILTAPGFRNAAILVMRLCEKGLAWFAPVCASWVFLCVSQTKRSAANSYYGDTSFRSVSEGNLMVLATLVLMQLAILRGVHVAMENPSNSFLFNFPPMKRFMRRCNMHTCITHRCGYETDTKIGKRISKKFRFISDQAWIKKCAKPCPCGPWGHERTTVSWVDGNGRKRCSGRPLILKKSGAYPEALGMEHGSDQILEVGQEWNCANFNHIKIHKLAEPSAEETWPGPKGEE